MDEQKTAFELVNYLVKRCYMPTKCERGPLHGDNCRTSGLRLRTVDIVSTHSRDAGQIRKILVLEGLVYSPTDWGAILSFPAAPNIIGVHETMPRLLLVDPSH